MRVRQIDLRRFKSLYDLTIRPGDLTVLFGPNNSGKTNIAEGVDFIGEVHRFGLELAIQRRGGYEAMAYRRIRRSRQPMHFNVLARLTLPEVRNAFRGRSRPLSVSPRSIDVQYSFSVRATSDDVESDYTVGNERLEMRWYLRDNRRTSFVQIEREEDRITVTPSEPDEAGGAGEDYPFRLAQFPALLADLPRSSLMIQVLRVNPIFAAFSAALSRMRVYQLSPLAMRLPSVPSPNPDLDRHGENLPSFVSYLQRSQPGAWGQVLRAMRTIVPNLERISVSVSPERRLSLKFHEDGIGRPWTSDEVSDGTMQGLALFAAVHDPRAPLMFVEEPENSVHAWILRVLIEECRKIEDKQIVLTSHSGVLLDQLRPTEVSVVWRQDSQTRLRRLVELVPRATQGWRDGKLLVFDLLSSGAVPQAVPGERQ